MIDIAIIDTSIATDNIGDEIIMQAVNEAIYEMFPKGYIFRVPSHDVLTRKSLGIIMRSSLCFVGGTNILASPGWRLRLHDFLFLRNAICLGVTWGAPDASVTYKRKFLLRHILSANYVHSVRDTYSHALLAKIGIESVSTTCPTMWKLTPEHCEQIPINKAPDALFTLTAYRRDPKNDRRMVEVLRRNYRHLYFFSQMHADLHYMESLNLGPVKTVGPTLHAYDSLLDSEDIDVIGSRLHGGIRALQRKRRAVIIGIDHRSIEIAKDTNLPVITRENIDELGNWIHGKQPTVIKLPLSEIIAWKAQFAGKGATNI